METLLNGFTLELCEGAFPLSTDSMALSEFVKLPRTAAVLDLGAGCGTLGMLLCASYWDCHVTGVEIDENAHNMAIYNANVNGVTDRYSSICADLCTIPSLVKPGSFHVCVSNPPYFSGGFQSKSVPVARQECLCTLDALFASAAWALRYGGDFFLVHKPERLAEICALGAKYQLEPKRLRLLRHAEDKEISLILVQCRKGGKPGLSWEEVALHHPDGSPTPYYKSLYHHQEA